MSCSQQIKEQISLLDPHTGGLVDPHSPQIMRHFESGATRHTDQDKLDFEGFLSVPVLLQFAEYMQKHQKQADGKPRESDNWQKGIPRNDYMKSLLRHCVDAWLHHRGYPHLAREPLQDALCGVLFNCQGYLDSLLRNLPK